MQGFQMWLKNSFLLYEFETYYSLNSFLFNVMICEKSIKDRINDWSLLKLKYIVFYLT